MRPTPFAMDTMPARVAARAKFSPTKHWAKEAASFITARPAAESIMAHTKYSQN